MTNAAQSGEQKPQAEWKPCEPGLITGFIQRYNRRRLLLLAAKTAGATACTAVVGLGGWLEYSRRAEIGSQAKGLTCFEVNELFPAYRKGKLDNARSDQLEKHVRKCSQCASLRAQLRDKSV